MTYDALTILIVDDNDDDREIYRRFLRTGPFSQSTVLEARDAAEALHCIRTTSLDCILLDFRLPDKDGLAVLERISQDLPASHPAVVMMTGQGDERVAVEAMKHGALDYLVKGVLTPEALNRAVLNAVQKNCLQKSLEAKQQELERIANLDDLTGLYNRRYFLTRLSEELSRWKRYQSACSVFMIDVDLFKRVNDTYGHTVGDEVLRGVGRVLRSCLRGSDLAARYGGEEFCVLATSTDNNGAMVFAERIRQLVQEETFYETAGAPFSITVSIGVAHAEDAQDPLALINLADVAMYRAKRTGRNRVVSFDGNLEKLTPNGGDQPDSALA